VVDRRFEQALLQPVEMQSRHRLVGDDRNPRAGQAALYLRADFANQAAADQDVVRARAKLDLIAVGADACTASSAICLNLLHGLALEMIDERREYIVDHRLVRDVPRLHVNVGGGVNR